MVWTYTEYYPGHPCLVDWVGNEWKGTIESTMDIDKIEPLPDGSHSVIVSNSILRPLFYLAPGKGRPYQLKTGSREELKRVLLSHTHEETTKGNQVQEIRQIKRPMIPADFEDFKQFAIYGAQRIPKIAREVVRDPNTFREDIPENELDLILRNRRNCLQVSSYDTIQKQLCHEFSGNITLWASCQISGGQIQPRVKPFNEDQLRELDTILITLI